MSESGITPHTPGKGFSVNSVAKRSGRTHGAIRKMVSKGQIRWKKIGGQIHVHPDDAQKLQEEYEASWNGEAYAGKKTVVL